MNSLEPFVHKLDVLSSWWCDLQLVLTRNRGQVYPTRKVYEEEKRSRERYPAFYVTRTEWHQSFSLDEIYKFETPTVKTIPALNNNLKFFHSATHSFILFLLIISLYFLSFRFVQTIIYVAVNCTSLFYLHSVWVNYISRSFISSTNTILQNKYKFLTRQFP